MKKEKSITVLRTVLLLFLCLCLVGNIPLYAKADEPLDYAKEQEERGSLPIQSNTIPGWPAGPAIGAQSAILMDIDTGVILYSKNIHEKLYPASTTKMLTCLLAMENGNLDDMVKFSYDAVFSVPADGSKIGMDVGQSITLEECLYGIMVGSANEAANAAGEYVSGSIEEFVDLMNTRAKELGCMDSHFCNTNGLHDDNHYTSAYDLALIGSEFFKNEMLCKIGNTPRYHFEATPTQPDDFYLNNKHQLINGELKYNGIMGGKTGYTDLARQTLVTGCEQNGMRLVCVVMKEESPEQFNDTATLFNYGFSNFSKVQVSDAETRYQIGNDNLFQTNNEIFGNSGQLLALDKNSSIIVPNTANISQLESTITYGTFDNPQKIGEINYTFHDTPIGSADLLLSPEVTANHQFETKSVTYYYEKQVATDSESTTPSQVFFINVKLIVISLTAIFLALFVLISIFTGIRSYHFAHHFNRKRKKKGLH